MKTLLQVALALVAFGILLVVYLDRPALAFLPTRPDAVDQGLHVMAALFIVALALERAIEVYVATFRNARAIQLKHAVERADEDRKFLEEDKKLVGDARDAKAKGLMDTHAAARWELVAFRSETQVYTMRLGLILGLAISALGFRVMQQLVTAIPDANAFQAAAFRGLDVAITGGLLAGGSKGIHAITQAIGGLTQAGKKQ